MKLRSTIRVFVLLLALAGSLTAGGTWVKQDSKTLAWLNDVFFLDENRGWIGGSNGEFLTTVDGGKSWVRQSKFTDDTIKEIHFFNDSNGWLLCERDVFALGSDAPSYVLKTADGGNTWSTVNFTENGRQRITTFFFSGNDRGLAIGESGVLLSVRENGSGWKKLPSPAPFLLNDGVFIDEFRGAIVGGAGTILLTEDAGATWKTSFVSGNANTKLTSVFFLNERAGWATGESGTIYQTVNGGGVWRRQESGVTANLTDIYFMNSAEGWAVGENGALLHSTTAGNIWQPIESKVRHRLEKILFVGKKGWIVGFGGTILHFDEGGRIDGPANPRPVIRSRN